MSTSTTTTTFRRRVRRGALALAVGAICLPSGSALAANDASDGYVGTHYPVAPSVGDTKFDLPGTPVQGRAGDTPADFPGMPGSPQAPPPVASHVPEASGFDWTSAAIGAGGAGLLIVVSLGGASAASRMRLRTVRS